MVNKLLNLLRSPYPALISRWKAVVYPSLIVFLILYLFQPFGISHIAAHKLWILMGYGFVSSFVLAVFFYLLPTLFPHYYKEETWILGRSMFNTLLICLSIGLCNAVYSILIFQYKFNWLLFVVSFFWVIILAPFPIVFLSLLNRNLILARNLREATKLNSLLSEEPEISASGVTNSHSHGYDEKTEDSESKDNSLISFTGGTKESFQVNASDLLYVEAEGNYVRIAYHIGDKIHQKLLRGTMKQAEDAVSACLAIIRCHRAFLVNTSAVVKVEGNMQGYRLHLKMGNAEVPVSRAYAKDLRKHLGDKI